MGASTYTRNNVLNAILRGTTLPLQSGTFISLHTADPGLSGANEVSTGDWPAYVRRSAEVVGAIGSGWTESIAGQSKNAKQVTMPKFDGTSVTSTHFGVWDAITGGNMIASGELGAPVTLAYGDIQVFDTQSLTATMT